MIGRSFATVAVCTRNRADSLRRTVDSTLLLDYPAGRWELLLVDNASTDRTPAVAAAFAHRHPGVVRVVREDRLGLSLARNRAIAEARGSIVAFLDDDAWPEPGWLAGLVGALSTDGVLVAGGPVEAELAAPQPAWLDERLLGYLSAWNRGSVEVECTWNEYPRGTNIAFRREAFDLFGAFDPELGRAGGSLLSGEEIELCLRIERGGGKIVYVPQSRVRHAVGAERLTPDWMLARVEAGGYGQAIIEWRHHGWLGIARGLARHGRNALASLRATGGRQSDALFARCQRRGLVGYSIGAARAVRMLARYSPLTP